MTWTVLLTAPQREFKVRDDLTLSDVPAYVPVEFRMGKGPGARALKKPIAPGYVFADIADWGMLRNVDGLRSRPVLAIDGQPITVSPAELHAIMELSRPLSALARGNSRLTPGQRIEIKRGNLIKLNGIIDRILRNGKAIALIELMGKTHAITITEEMVA
jgi:hypothetical protein